MEKEDFSFNKTDEMVLKFWDENEIFEKSLLKNKDNPLWTFLDGPPFVNGTPHSGHVLVSYVKDTVIRFKSMNGYFVPRTIGFDCHGLPLEQAAEKKIGLSSKDEITQFGIANYNNVCREIIDECSDKWENCFHKMGRWVNLENQYKTMDKTFMETEWWAFKELFRKGLIYKGFKIMPYSYACTTALSNFEANSNYKEVIDQSATVTFPIVNDDRFNNTSFLAWTTTPWTLPSNLALCVNPKMTYVKVWDKKREHFYILAEDLVKSIYAISKKNLAKDLFSIEETYLGSELIGIKYESVFSYYNNDAYFQVVADDFVSNDSGTGIVHLAPAFGADDFRICIDNDIVSKNGDRLACPVDECGLFTDNIIHYKKRCVKDCDKDIIKDLKNRSRLFSQEPYRHNYPHCWRTDKPLIYKCVDAWFINVESLKADLLKNNMQTNWIPNNIKEARFHNWLKDAKDWCVSRTRYWGTPIPIWISDDGEEIRCIGSIKELIKATGIDDIDDLHREFVDDLTIPSLEGRGILKKIPDVFDCWYESGLCGLASHHYPFENKEYIENNYPVDFISESLDQTRGWFYTLTVLSTALFNKPAFKNVIVTGLILAKDGTKMSKRLKNYTDPLELINEFGSDPMRLYLISSPVVRAEPFSFKDEGVKHVIRKLLPWYNGFKFFMQCYKKFKISLPDEELCLTQSNNIMDIWIDKKLNTLLIYIRKNMNEFKLYKIHDALMEFINQLTNWYIKFNRERLKGLHYINAKDNWKQSLLTLYNVLFKFTKIMAPFTPFFCEFLYKNLKELGILPSETLPISIHLFDYPNVQPDDNNIDKQMTKMQHVIDMIRKLKLNTSRPIKRVIVCHKEIEWRNDIHFLQDYIISETNIMNFEIKDINNYVKYYIVPQKGNIGKKFKKEAFKVVKLIQETKLEDLGNLTFGTENITDEYYLVKPELNIETEYEFMLENDILIFMDTKQDENVLVLHDLCQFKREIQNLRKDIGLEGWDKIKIYYANLESKLALILGTHKTELQKILNYDILPITELDVNSDIIVTKELNVNEHKIEVVLIRD
jgi:isoleucyl-tRNA synthetase